jgi:hypothetical protein
MGSFKESKKIGGYGLKAGIEASVDAVANLCSGNFKLTTEGDANISLNLPGNFKGTHSWQLWKKTLIDRRIPELDVLDNNPDMPACGDEE